MGSARRSIQVFYAGPSQREALCPGLRCDDYFDKNVPGHMAINPTNPGVHTVAMNLSRPAQKRERLHPFRKLHVNLDISSGDIANISEFDAQPSHRMW